MPINDLIGDIKEIYPGTLMLTKAQTGKITNRSENSLNRDIKNGTGIPYKQSKDKGKVLYPIRAVAQWMLHTITTD